MFYKYKFIIVSVSLIISLIILFLVDLYIGTLQISLFEIIKFIFGLKTDSEQTQIILAQIRLPRVVTAVLAGSALSVSGLLMQTVFRNPLAGPDVLGVNAGASLGVAVLMLGFGSFLNIEFIEKINTWTLILAATSGAGGVLILVSIISIRVNDVMTILILGIMFGSAVIAIVSVLQYFSNAELLKSYFIWTMGSLGGVTSNQIPTLSFIVFLGIIVSFLTSKQLNVLLLGEVYAQSLGLNLKLSRLIIFTSTSLLSGSITAFCGPIGFIAIAVPHLARIVFKTSNHFYLIPITVLIGSILMILSDIITHFASNNQVLPINSVTALIGIPIVIWMVIKNFKFSK